MTKLSDVVFESADHFVTKKGKGFEVYKIGVTCATRVAVIGYSGDEGLSRAKREILRREEKTP